MAIIDSILNRSNKKRMVALIWMLFISALVPAYGQCFFGADTIAYYGNQLYKLKIENDRWHLKYSWREPSYVLDVNGRIYYTAGDSKGVLVPNKLIYPILFVTENKLIKNYDSLYLIIDNVKLPSKKGVNREFLLSYLSKGATEKIVFSRGNIPNNNIKYANKNEDTTLLYWSDTIAIPRNSLKNLTITDKQTQQRIENIILMKDSSNLYSLSEIELELYINNISDVSKEFVVNNDRSKIELTIRGQKEVLDRYFDTKLIQELYFRCDKFD
jgi:hypothetical protein